MKSACIPAAICLVLLAGCRSADEKEPAAAPTANADEQRSKTAQSPYFYGLIEEYRTILAEDPNNLAAIIALGNAYSDSGAWREAIRLYERALKIDPRNADVRTDMGTAYRNLGMPDRALAEYRRALEHEPGHLNAHYNMGIVYAYDLKEYQLATHVWEELLRIAPNHPKADSLRAHIATFRKTLRKGGK